MARYDAAKRRQQDIDKEARKLADELCKSREEQILKDQKELKFRREEMDKRERDLDNREQAVQNAENTVDDMKRQAREEAVAEIRENETMLRQECCKQLVSEAEKRSKDIEDKAQRDADQKRKEADIEKARIIADATAEADQLRADAESAVIEREKAVKEREAELKKALDQAQRAEDAAQRAQTHYENEVLQALSAERGRRDSETEELFASLRQQRDQLAQQKAELDIQRDDLEGESAYVQELKKKYQSASPERLQQLDDTIQRLTQNCSDREERIKELLSRLDEINRTTNGQSFTETARRLEEAEKKCRQLDAELANRPSVSEYKQLQQDSTELARLRADNTDLLDKVNRLQTQLNAAAYAGRELDISRMEARALKVLNDQMMERLRYFSQAYETAREDKFAGLLEIDAAIEKKRPQKAASPSRSFDSLEELTYYIQQYAASKGLFYEDETIRVFLASMAASYTSSRLILLQGLSGTGKSSLPRIVAEAMGAECRFVSVQPSWRDNRDLLGYDNDFTHRFKETEFTKILYQASADEDTIWFVVLDEVNLARIEYYFADFLSELERQDKTSWSVPLISNYQPEGDRTPRHLSLSSGTASLIIRKNVWFIGTANNDDSTSTITDKVYDRAQILDMEHRAKEQSVGPIEKRLVSLANLESLFAAAQKDPNKTISGDLVDYIELLDSEYLQRMDITFGNRIKMQLQAFMPVYVAGGGTRYNAIDYYLAHKILRRLDERYDIYIADNLKSMIKELRSQFGDRSIGESQKKVDILMRKNFSSGGEE